jgi:membrane-associated protease RseP (regulator of RpoE activity)
VTPENAKFFNLTDANGAVVSHVESDSPAAKAGLKTGDVITELNGNKVTDASDLQLAVGQMHPGTTVKLGLLRDGKSMTVPGGWPVLSRSEGRGFHVCTTMVYTGAMPVSKQVRRSVTLPLQVAKQVDNMAKRRRLSDNRVLVELIEEGIQAQKQKENAFFELAERFRAAKDPEDVKRLGDKLGRFVFGE